MEWNSGFCSEFFVYCQDKNLFIIAALDALYSTYSLTHWGGSCRFHCVCRAPGTTRCCHPDCALFKINVKKPSQTKFENKVNHKYLAGNRRASSFKVSTSPNHPSEHARCAIAFVTRVPPLPFQSGLSPDAVLCTSVTHLLFTYTGTCFTQCQMCPHWVWFLGTWGCTLCLDGKFSGCGCLETLQVSWYLPCMPVDVCQVGVVTLLLSSSDSPQMSVVLVTAPGLAFSLILFQPYNYHVNMKLDAVLHPTISFLGARHVIFVFFFVSSPLRMCLSFHFPRDAQTRLSLNIEKIQIQLKLSAD